jgi:lambda repressor-like predicted transcriptional regulator
MNASNGNESGGTTDHPADVLAALKKSGRSLAGLSVTNGYHPTAAGKALKQPWPAIEQLLAAAIGVMPQEIWPSRYDRQGNPRKRIQMARPVMDRAAAKSAVRPMLALIKEDLPG